ncbi:MAG TPA: hypothetical protein VMU33_11265 [Burkholderiaceae bacterium]|nr:hypothetical protein [Burkholderiaceae bacterium]
MAKITLQQLTQAGACADQVSAFRHVFGDAAEVTMDNAWRAHGHFDWSAAAAKFLDLEHLLDFEDRVEEARHAFVVGRRALRAAYQAGGSAATFDAAMQPLYDARDKVYAVAFTECYLAQHGH